MADMADTMVDILIAVVLFTALLPVIITQFNGASLDNLTISGTSYDFSWAPYVVILALFVLLIRLAIKKYKNK